MDNTATDISICTTALLELGSRPINSFVEDNEPARLCSNLYPYVRDEMLRQHPWNFAKKRRLLGPDNASPAFGYTNQFTIPSDFIRLLEVNEQTLLDGVSWPVGYAYENGKILANVNQLRMRYIYANHIPGTWDSSFIRLMVCAMKKALAYAITRDQAAVSAAMQEWALALQTAKTVNGIEIPAQTLAGDAFMGARF